MIKLSELLKQKGKINGTEFKEKIAKSYFKEIILEYIEDLTQQENIEECDVSFNKNSLRRDLSLDDAIDIISGEAELKIIECVNNLISFHKIKESPEEELEEQELNY